jgi:ABC-type glycerol-3-phosphate transport system substrate-binding protein
MVEIDFLHIHGGIQQAAVQRQIAAFNQSQSRYRVRELFVQGSYEGAVEKLQAMNAAGQVQAVAQGGFVYHKFYIGAFPITPVAQFIEAERFDLSDFPPAMLALGQDDKSLQPELMGDFLTVHPNAAVTYRQLDEMVPWYNFPGRGGTRIYKVVQDAIQDAFLGKTPPRRR